MKIEEAISILKKHNKWRRGGKGKMQDPKKLGLAIDYIIDYYNQEQISIINSRIILSKFKTNELPF